ncbi:unannotated protein [freshwater metagenome]|uniref:Unannotated protein n=1 Tax=freshwater metagenome TaxID=449393 RepID=A0A6J6QLT8_9ZZZZ
MQFLVVGGGGGGGGGVNDMNYYTYYGAGSGGGGGEVRVCTETVTPAETWTATVGAGGYAGTSRTDGFYTPPQNGHGGNGGESSIVRANPAAGCTAAGGQGGGEADGQVPQGPARVVHASRLVAGGAAQTPTPGTGGASGSANDGGNGLADANSGLTSRGGGGGGSGTGAVGGDASGIGTGGAGGDGTYPTGWFADFRDGLGGGGGGGALGTGGAGSAGGGNGTSCTGDGYGQLSCSFGQEAGSFDNLASRGGGGGGAAADGSAGPGAIGLVIARYEVGGTTDCVPAIEPTDLYATTQDCVVPAGVTKILMVVVGGGGGGGKGTANAGGGGGGGGALSTIQCADIQVTPGDTLSLTVGAGGSGDSGSGASDGGTSSVVSTASVNPLCEAPGGTKGVLDGGASGSNSLGGAASASAGGGGGGGIDGQGDPASSVNGGNGARATAGDGPPFGGGGGGGSATGSGGSGADGGGNGRSGSDTACAVSADASANTGGGGGGGSPLCNGGDGGSGFVVLFFDVVTTQPCINGLNPVDGQSGYTYDGTGPNPGVFSCTLPDGVTSVDILVVGGGGGGGWGNVTTGSVGGGGGGGEVKVCTGITVTPGNTLDLSAGTAGNGGAGGVAGYTAATPGATTRVSEGEVDLCAASGGEAGKDDLDQTDPGDGGTSGSLQAGGIGELNSGVVEAGDIVEAGGGGGGATAPGAAGASECGGNGGNGQTVSDLASPGLFSTLTDTFGGGGGGGSLKGCSGELGGLGGSGGGGAGQPAATWGAQAATAFGGGGGGGSPSYCAPGDGPCGGGGGGQGGYIELRFTADPSAGRVWIERGGVALQDSTPADTSCANPGYTTITAAVAAASADDVIHVCSGTYREAEITPTVDNLTILGEEYSADNAPQGVSTPLSPPVVIDGELTEGDATSRHRIFDATGLKITFKNVRLRNGGVEGYGGAVKAFQVMVEDSVFNDNDAFGGGAVYVSTDGNTPPCGGPIGSLFGPGTLDCAPVLANPPATPLISVVGSEFTDNGTGSSIDGGALYANGGTVTSTGSTFSGNEALLAQEPPLASDGAGGAILAQLVVVYGSTFTGNKALFHGGAIAATTVRVFPSSESPKVASVFDANEALGDSNSDGYGGALWADQVEVEAASFVSNLADSGGAIASAAVLNDGPVTPAVPVSGTVSVTASTFESNSATVDGGAVLNKAVGGSTTVYNSTFSANHAGNAGGGVYAQAALSVSFSTFDANTAGVSGGVFWTPVAPSVDNNIFSFAAADETEAVHNGCLTYEWTPAKDTTNLTTNYWCPGTVVEAPATLDLSPLADNGGPTETMAIGTSSAALDGADQTECDSRTDPSDQRGVNRPVGSACDIGAFEYYGSITLDTTPGVESELTVPTGASTLYFLLVGGGGGGAHGGGSEAGGGGGGGQVVECTVDVTDSDTVIYYFGQSGVGGDGTNPATAGENSYVKVNGEIPEGCEALGGQPGSPAAEGGNGGASGNPSFAGGSGATAAPLVEIVAGGGGAGAGGAGGDGSYDSVTFMATGGAGGAGKAASSSSFGDTAVLLGGGGGGGAFICSVDSSMTAGDGGVGGGGSGSTDSCVTRPIGSRGAPGGGDSSGGGGGGGAGSVSGGEGGTGGGEVRTSAPTDSAEQLHVCVKKLYVVYGARSYNPEPFLCVPEIDECAPPTSPTLTPVSGSDPECCPTVTAPVDGSDPDHCDDVRAPESVGSDGYSTVSGDDVLKSGLVADLKEEADDVAPAVATPALLHYEHGIPEGWRKASLDEFPGVVLPTCSTEYEQGDDVTDPTDPTTWLPITCEGGDPLEYEFNYEFIDGLRIYPAVLKVKPKHLRVAYGTAEPSPYDFTIKGFKLGETADVLTDLPVCDSEYTDTAEAGSRFDITCLGGVADNYTFKYEKSHIHVQKVKVSLRAADRVVTYGDPAPDYSFGLSGLRGPDSALSPERLAGFVAPSCSSTYTSVTSAGTVDIDCVGAVSTNYEFEPVKGTVTVRKASLRVIPKPVSVTYGSSAPTVPATVTGFVNAQTATTAAGFKAPTCSASGYTVATNVGVVPITCTGGSASNYTFDNTASSSLTITKATASITAASRSVVYGTAAPAFTSTMSGLKNGQTAGTVAGLVAPVCSSTYTALTNVGTVPVVSCAGASSTNYNFTYVTGKVTVTKAPLTVTANSLSVVKGSAVPSYTYTVVGFVNGQTTSVLTARPKCTSSYTTRSAIGSYTITCSSAAAANYTVTYKTGTLTVR